MEKLVDRKLYTHCVRYGKIVENKEYKTNTGYIRHLTFEIGKCKMFFLLKNGEIIDRCILDDNASKSFLSEMGQELGFGEGE